MTPLVIVFWFVAQLGSPRLPTLTDAPDQLLARAIAGDARDGRETRVTMALADYGKGQATVRRDRITAIFTEVLGRPTRQGSILVWRGRRMLTVERVPMDWGEGLRIVVE